MFCCKEVLCIEVIWVWFVVVRYVYFGMGEDYEKECDFGVCIWGILYCVEGVVEFIEVFLDCGLMKEVICWYGKFKVFVYEMLCIFFWEYYVKWWFKVGEF